METGAFPERKYMSNETYKKREKQEKINRLNIYSREKTGWKSKPQMGFGRSFLTILPNGLFSGVLHI